MTISRRPAAYLAIVAGLACLSGCVRSWKPQSASPQQVLDSTGATSVQVRLRSGGKVEIRDPAIRNDSLIGWLWKEGKDTTITKAWGAPLADVDRIATLGNNVPANIGIGILVGAALFLASIITTFAIVCADGGCD